MKAFVNSEKYVCKECKDENTHEYCHNMSTCSTVPKLLQEATKRSGTKPHEEPGMGSRKKGKCATLCRAHQRVIASKHGIT